MVTIQDLGAIGELLGAIAVIASVLYLALQIRHGMQGYKSNITQQVSSHFSMLQMEIAKNDSLLRSWGKAQSGQPLDTLDQSRVLYVVQAFLIGFENMYFQYRAGMIDENSYQARRIVMGMMIKIPGALEWWNKFGRYQHPNAFVEEVEHAMEDFEKTNGGTLNGTS